VKAAVFLELHKDLEVRAGASANASSLASSFIRAT
jgi:hypothetical protein